MIEWWIAALDLGALSYDSEEGRWRRDWNRLPDSIRLSSLV
jgi:hypothetical protein